jgi:hypothetical protein
MEVRPNAVVVVSAFLFVATGIAAVVGVWLLFPNPLLDRLWALNRPGEALFRSIGRAAGIPLLGLGAGTACATLGLLRRKKWAWYFAVALFTIDGCGDVVSLVATGERWKAVGGILVSSLFLYMLTRRSVRRYFA